MVIHICTHSGCHASFLKPSLLKAHFFTHTDERPFVCSYDNCNKKYTRATHLKRHTNVFHMKVPDTRISPNDHDQQCNGQILVKEECVKVEQGESLKLDHTVPNSGESSDNGQSSLFQSAYMEFLSVESALPKVHTDIMLSLDDHQQEQSFSLDYSSTQSHSNAKEYHKIPIKTENNYVCTMPNCNSSFKSKETVKKHIKNYHELRKFECNDCGLKFRKHQHLKVHSFEHTKIKPFKCNLCEQSFLIPSKLRNHQKVHVGYFCSHPGCSVKVEKWTEMRKHMKIMHPSKHVCPTCNKTFLNKSNLKDHIKIHASEREAFHCPYSNCVRYYYYLKNLRQHVKSVHEGHRLKCKHDGCNKSYKKKKNLVQHEEVHNPGYVSPKKIRRRRKPVPISEKLSGLNPIKFSQCMIESINCTSISDIEMETGEIFELREKIPPSSVKLENNSCAAQESQHGKSVIEFKSNDNI